MTLAVVIVALAAVPPPPVPVFVGPDGGSQVIVSETGRLASWRTLPDCQSDGGSALGYTSASRTFSCNYISGGGSGAPATAQYWVGAADGTLSAEKNLGALSTGLVLNTAGTPSAYGGASCTNQFPRSLNASGAATCASVSLTADVTGTLAQANGGTGAGSLSCSASERLTSNGTAYSCSALPVTTAYSTIQDEGSPLTQRSTVNFTGAGVSCTDSGGITVCTISGGGGGGTSPLILAFGGF